MSRAYAGSVGPIPDIHPQELERGTLGSCRILEVGEGRAPARSTALRAGFLENREKWPPGFTPPPNRCHPEPAAKAGEGSYDASGSAAAYAGLVPDGG
jgi:hypothetical protein